MRFSNCAPRPLRRPSATLSFYARPRTSCWHRMPLVSRRRTAATAVGAIVERATVDPSASRALNGECTPFVLQLSSAFGEDSRRRSFGCRRRRARECIETKADGRFLFLRLVRSVCQSTRLRRAAIVELSTIVSAIHHRDNGKQVPIGLGLYRLEPTSWDVTVDGSVVGASVHRTNGRH